MQVGAHTIGIDEAKDAIAGYCFATTDVTFATDAKHRLSGTVRRSKWAYRTYDCAPRDPRPTLEIADILVTSGINGRMNVTSISAVLGVREQVNELLGQLRADRPFWDLDHGRLRSRTYLGPEGTLWCLWDLLSSVKGIGVASFHKILHHKRPHQFPLLDNVTEKELRPRSRTWAKIHEQARHREFCELEDWFTQRMLREEEGDVPLTRLRLHDILLWLSSVNGQFQCAVEHGPQIREERGDGE